MPDYPTLADLDSATPGAAPDPPPAPVSQAQPILEWLDSAVPAEGWLGGEAFSVGDIAVASVLRTMGYVGMDPDAARHPATAGWYARVNARPAWLAVAQREAKIIASAMRQ